MGSLLSLLGTGRARRQGAFYKAYKINDQLGHKLLAVGIGKKQLYALHEIFNLMDRDNSGEINVIEFFNHVDIKRTRFSEKAFTVMDRDGSGEVDFIEFVLAVWNYCSFSKTSLVRYAFDLYDSDGSGEIEKGEASHCVREIWGSDWEHNANAQRVLAKLEAVMQSNPNGRLTVQMFQDFAQTHPMLLFPAFQLQTEIQHRILGERFWEKAARRRSTIDPKELNWQNFERLVKMSHQSSQNFLQTVENALHDNIFEEVQPAPVARKRSSLHNMLTKVASRKTKVFLEAKNRSGDSETDRLGNATATAVSSFASTASFPSSSPTAKKRKSTQQAAATRPALLDLTQQPTHPLASDVDSLGELTKHLPAATSPTHSLQRGGKSPKKKKPKTPATQTDLVVEDVADLHGSS